MRMNYAYADVSLVDRGKAAKQQKGWVYNVIHAAGNEEESAPWTYQRKRKRVGWITVSTLEFRLDGTKINGEKHGGKHLTAPYCNHTRKEWG